MLPLGRRFAALITLIAAAIVLGLAALIAVGVTRSGRLDALDQWLTCDALGALIVLLVALVGFHRRSVFSGVHRQPRRPQRCRQCAALLRPL